MSSSEMGLATVWGGFRSTKASEEFLHKLGARLNVHDFGHVHGFVNAALGVNTIDKSGTSKAGRWLIPTPAGAR
jgi:hypothetical protein